MYFKTWCNWGVCVLFRLRLDDKEFLSTTILERQLTQKTFSKQTPKSHWNNNNFDSVKEIRGEILVRYISCQLPSPLCFFSQCSASTPCCSRNSYSFFPLLEITSSRVNFNLRRNLNWGTALISLYRDKMIFFNAK